MRPVNACIRLLLALAVPAGAAAADVPDSFVGEWASAPERCGSGSDDLVLRISATHLGYWESHGPIRAVVLLGKSEMALVTELSDEGETWLSASTFKLSADGLQLSEASSQHGHELVRYKCAESIDPDTSFEEAPGEAPRLLSAAHASAVPPHIERYPDLDDAKATPVLVIARVSPGKMLPQFDECRKPDVICLHSPLWFNARVMKSIYGAAPGDTLEVATTSHYGMMAYKDSPGPRLILLLVEGDKVVMPTYSEAELIPRDDGELFLVPRFGHGPDWLPCSAWSVKEELAPKRFPGLRGIQADDYAWKFVTETPELFHVRRDVAYPRYGVSVSALQAHLEKTRPDAKGFSCEQEDGDVSGPPPGNRERDGVAPTRP